MTVRITEMFEAGEIINTQKNAVFGWLRLRGLASVVRLNLTGNGSGRLASRHAQCARRSAATDGTRPPSGDPPPPLRSYQIGPVVEFSLVDSEANHPAARGGVTPKGEASSEATRGEGQLTLRWFGQDGEVLLDRCRVEYVLVGANQEELLEYLAESTRIGASWSADQVAEPSGEHPPGEREDRPWQRWLDELCSGGRDIPISEIFRPSVRLAAERRLTDRQCAEQLLHVLARLARHGIALDMCEHFTPRMAYRLLTEKLLREEFTHPDLPESGYVQHLMTHEHCRQCEAELQAMFDEGFGDW